ncbi:MAG: serine protein kinase PrkA, partial [Thermoplasmata archaeon]
HTMREQEQGTMIPFEEFLEMLVSDPQAILRNVFQIFHDMVRSSVGEGINEYPDDPENIGFVYYDCSRLFVEGADHPFFADRLFANRLVHLVEALKRGAQQNKIYVFDGPPGCGKSTFLNNLLRKFEEYANTPEGKRFEIVWRLDRKLLGGRNMSESLPVLEKLSELLERGMHHGYEGYSSPHEPVVAPGQLLEEAPGDFVEIPCPSHDNPILVVPKEHRESFFRELLGKNGFAHELMTAKEYEWVFRETPCTICSCLYEALLDRLQNPEKVLSMVYARPYRFRRRLGEGISIFNPGDKPMRQEVLSNSILQRKIDTLFKASKRVQYLFSRYAKTNNGVYALMDIKSHNKERLIELHNIVSEGVHKVEDMEENVNSLFLAVMNPEDKKNIQDYQSFLDRIEYINIPYVLDLKTEVKIYKSIFGGHIEKSFLPMVLENFARVIISSRLNTKSEALVEWIGDPEKYSLYCDRNLHLLKMEIYTGNIPSWLSDEDRKGFTAKRRRKILAEAEEEGQKGFSGRDSLKIFNEFYSSAGKDRLIDMPALTKFFTKVRPDLEKSIPDGFLDSLVQLYNYRILQEVKESLYYYNEEQIARDIQNYLFALNFETGVEVTCTFTGDRLEITDPFFEAMEKRILGEKVEPEKHLSFRAETQKEYTSRTLTQEIMVEGKKVVETRLYQDLHERYVYNLKERVLEPFLKNENFRRAIKDYDTEPFKTYDKRIREDITFLMGNLIDKYGYTEKGAKEVCMYVIDNDLAKTFSGA